MTTGPNETSPRVFISHASEDKSRFVREFGERLRASGIDAWVDEWEILAGDSLVERIFEGGIATAMTVIVVLSKVSVAKPWVREELNSAVVKRIQSDGAMRLIPVVLDDDVELPMALRHLKWESVSRQGMNGVLDAVIEAILGLNHKPPLGATPIYTRYPRPQITDDAIDDLVFGLVVDELAKWGPSATVVCDHARSQAEQLGIGRPRFDEALHALVAQQKLAATPMLGGGRWLLKSVPDHVWLQVERTRGVDIDDLRLRILGDIVNRSVTRFDPTQLEAHPFTVLAIARELQRDQLITMSVVIDGTVVVTSVSPLAARTLRRQSL